VAMWVPETGFKLEGPAKGGHKRSLIALPGKVGRVKKGKKVKILLEGGLVRETPRGKRGWGGREKEKRKELPWGKLLEQLELTTDNNCDTHISLITRGC